MRAHGKRKPRARTRRHPTRRPFLIDAEDFEFMDDCEMYDWMYGFPSDPGPAAA
jgi:hypothetical protein